MGDDIKFLIVWIILWNKIIYIYDIQVEKLFL